MDKKISPFIYWTPRILSILFIIFLAMFSLDVFSSGLSFRQIAIGLFMHNIPVFFLIAALVIAWKREIVGGAAFILAGMLYAAMVLKTAFTSGFQWYYLSWMLEISGMAFFIGVMFLVGWSKKKK
jgi:hypothetical protein